MIRVLIVDDQPIVRQGLRMLLTTIRDLEVSGEANNGVEAVQKAVELQPDLLIMDARMPDQDGIEATRAIKQLIPEVLIIIISAEGGEELRRRADAAGAFAFAEKGNGQSPLLRELYRAIRMIQSRKRRDTYV